MGTEVSMGGGMFKMKRSVLTEVKRLERSYLDRDGDGCSSALAAITRDHPDYVARGLLEARCSAAGGGDFDRELLHLTVDRAQRAYGASEATCFKALELASRLLLDAAERQRVCEELNRLADGEEGGEIEMRDWVPTVASPREICG